MALDHHLSGGLRCAVCRKTETCVTANLRARLAAWRAYDPELLDALANKICYLPHIRGTSSTLSDG
jgi:hypothetical protein